MAETFTEEELLSEALYGMGRAVRIYDADRSKVEVKRFDPRGSIEFAYTKDDGTVLHLMARMGDEGLEWG